MSQSEVVQVNANNVHAGGSRWQGFCALTMNDWTIELLRTPLGARIRGHAGRSRHSASNRLRWPNRCNLSRVPPDGQSQRFVEGLRIARPDVPIVMRSGFCSLPCTHLQDADICVQDGDSAALLSHPNCDLPFAFRSVSFRRVSDDLDRFRVHNSRARFSTPLD